MSSSEVDAVDSIAGRPSAEKVWRVGSITYTMAGVVILFSWLLWGDFAWSMKERSVYSVVQLMLRKFGASDLLLGLLMGTLPNAIGMVLGPVISYRSDRHRGRWGRRIPYLLITTPIAVFAMVGMACCPVLGRMLHQAVPELFDLNTAVLLFFGLFWVIFEIGTLAANAIFGALINDVVPSCFLGRFFALFRALSLLAGMCFNYWLLGKAEVYYHWVFIGIGALYGIGFLMMCLKVKEGEYPEPVQNDDPRSRGFFGAAKIYFRECFSNKYYLWVFGAYTLSILAFGPVNTFSLFFAKSLQMDMTLYGRYLALTYLISLCLSYFLGMLADRYHPLRVGIVTIAIYFLAALWGGLFISGPQTFAVAFVAHGVVSGVFFTTTASYGQRLFPKARFAQFNSALALIMALGNMLLAPAVGRFLDYTHHAYRYTYLLSAALALLGLVASLVLCRKFAKLGGVSAYQAPE